ncbi:MAG: GAF domain-containing protein [Burkholderiaceae bacterium]
MEFWPQDLVWACAAHRETVISNNPRQDARAGGLPPGHPAMESFLAIPIDLNGRLVAMVGLANRPDGFDSGVVSQAAAGHRARAGDGLA